MEKTALRGSILGGIQQVRRLMQLHGIRARCKRKFVVTTDSKHHLPIAPDLVQRNFTPTAPNQIWTGDITYIATDEGWLYLAAVIDLFSRQVVGWSMQPHMQSSLVTDALKMAWFRRRPAPGLIFHSDRGSQYTSNEHKELLKEHKMVGSMSRKGNPYDNAPMESFFRLLKVEHVYKRSFATLEQAAYSMQKWFDYYNHRRRHSSLGGISPLMYEFSRNHPFGLSA